MKALPFRWGSRTKLAALVVDDDEEMRGSVASLLARAGHEVTQAADGAVAMALLDARRFDVAVVDVRIPAIDGLSLFRNMLRETPATAVILMTARAVIADAVAAVRDGAFDYVVKPFETTALLRTVRRVAQRLAVRRSLERAREAILAHPVGAASSAGAPLSGSRPERMRLLAHFLKCFTPRGHIPPGVSVRAWAALAEYGFPAGLREFEHAIEHALVLSRGSEIDLQHLPAALVGAHAGGDRLACTPTLDEAKAGFEREYLLRVARAAPTRRQAALVLGISGASLREMLHRHGISDADLQDRPRRTP
jgi:DNA-binding NtrC family response regulator